MAKFLIKYMDPSVLLVNNNTVYVTRRCDDPPICFAIRDNAHCIRDIEFDLMQKTTVMIMLPLEVFCD